MTIKITTEQLEKIVREAVEEALRKIGDVEIVNSVGKSPSVVSDNTPEIGTFSDEQYKEAMEVMAANRGKGNEPKVGIFWYNVARNELFGVVSHKRSDYLRPNAGGGLITCSEMHEDVWKKEFHKQKYHGGNVGPFKGAYQDKPRGRVFYSPAEDLYIIAAGSWINKYPDAIRLITEEYDLPEEHTVVRQAEHWDIGQTWK